ncbi:MAG: sulfate permease [Gammaproteobacteria bacterium]|nr:sulfate permease [Gammaproteobacteria bacterium]
MNNVVVRSIVDFVRVWPGMFFPFRAWIGELKDPITLRADILAGLTVAMVLIPQSMAYAQLAGLPAYYGLYASFLPPIVAALLGSSRQLGTGPVAVVSLLTAAALEPIAGANPEGYIVYAVMLAFMVGIFQLSLGLFKLGVLVDFLSHPVVMGFTNAGALIIATSQLSKLFGVTAETAEHYYETIWRVMVAITESTHWPTLAMAVIAISIMWYLSRNYPKVPNVLIAVAFTTILSYVIGFQDMGGRIVGTIPEGLPPFSLPTFDMSVFGQLVSAAVVIALIGFMEAISIAKAMAAQTRQRIDANQELVGQGISNIVSGFSQGYPVSGSFSRSAVNINNGAITGFSSVVTGSMVGVTLLFLTPLLYHLPQATLAAIIIMAVIKLIKFAPVKAAWQVQPHDAIVSVITFALTLIMAPHLDKGIIVGVLLSLGLYTWRSMRPRMAILSRHADDTLRDAEVHILKTCDHISVMRFDGSLYFANSGYFENKVLERIAVKPDLKYIMVDAEGINEIDATGEEMLHELTNRLGKQGIELVFSRAKKPLIDVFNRTGLTEHLGGKTLFRTRTRALKYIWQNILDKDLCRCDCDCPRECPLNFNDNPVILEKTVPEIPEEEAETAPA